MRQLCEAEIEGGVGAERGYVFLLNRYEMQKSFMQNKEL